MSPTWYPFHLPHLFCSHCHNSRPFKPSRPTHLLASSQHFLLSLLPVTSFIHFHLPGFKFLGPHPSFYLCSCSLPNYVPLAHWTSTFLYDPWLTLLLLAQQIDWPSQMKGPAIVLNLSEPPSLFLCPFQQWSHERGQGEPKPANCFQMRTIFLKHSFDYKISCLENSCMIL